MGKVIKRFFTYLIISVFIVSGYPALSQQDAIKEETAEEIAAAAASEAEEAAAAAAEEAAAAATGAAPAVGVGAGLRSVTLMWLSGEGSLIAHRPWYPNMSNATTIRSSVG